MSSVVVSEVLVGIYLGLLTGLFPALIAFAIGFVFKYFTDVTVPGLGVVVLGGALAGVSGGLMGLMEPELAESWTGITALLVILMACLWAHSQGDRLGDEIPRRLTLKTLRSNRLSADLAERVDSFGQVRVRPTGTVRDIEGYPPLAAEVAEKIAAGSWKFPPDLSLSELELRLEERLVREYDLAEVDVTVDRRGYAEIAAAPSAAGLSRRVPEGERAVSIRTLLPTGLARADEVTVKLPDGAVRGPVVSARTGEASAPSTESPQPSAGDGTGGSTGDGTGGTGSAGGTGNTGSGTPTPDGGTADAEGPPAPRRAPTTTGGEGTITISIPASEARRVLRHEFAPTVVHSRGTQREYEVIAALERADNRFGTVTVGENSPLADATLGSAAVREAYGVAVLAVTRGTERVVAPDGDTELRAGDRLIVVGQADQLGAFSEVVG